MKITKYKTQVDKKHYKFEEYVNTERWISYYYQIDGVNKVAKRINKKAINVLEIGVGNKLVSKTLKTLDMKVTTMDIDPELKPDIVSVLPDVNVPKKRKFDCILCCEVLEHIQYDDVEKSLKNMAKVSKYSVISVPHKSLWFSFAFKIMFFPTFKFIFSVPTSFRKHKFLGEHYWELGYRGYSLERFKKSLHKSGFILLEDFRLAEFPWHHFFIVKSKHHHE